MIVSYNLQNNHLEIVMELLYIFVNCKQIYLPVIFEINAKPKRNNFEFILTKLLYTFYHIRAAIAMVQFTNAYVAIAPFIDENFGNGNIFILGIRTSLRNFL